MRLAVGEDYDCRFLRHLDDVSVVVRADGVGNFEQAFLIGAAIGKRVGNHNATISPSLCESAALRDGRVILCRRRRARVHQHEHGIRLVAVPCATEPVTEFLFVSSELRSTNHAVLEGESHLPARVVCNFLGHAS